MKKIFSIISLAALTIGLLGSCKKPDPVIPVEGTLTMEVGGTEFDWNKITISIKGTDIVSGSYYFNESAVVDAGGNLEELVNRKGVKLTAEQIVSVNSAEGLTLIEESLKEETEYKTVLVVSNSFGSSKTLTATKKVGQAPPPM